MQQQGISKQGEEGEGREENFTRSKQRQWFGYGRRLLMDTESERG